MNHDDFGDLVQPASQISHFPRVTEASEAVQWAMVPEVAGSSQDHAV